MKLAVIVDNYPPNTSSAATQMSALIKELSSYDINIILIIPDNTIEKSYEIHDQDNIKIFKYRLKNIRKQSYMLRAIYEVSISYRIIRLLKKAQIISNLDGIIWYSPTIFYGPLIKWLKKKYICQSMCILRDIFPQWILDLKIIKKGLVYYFFKIFENHQYNVADIIAVQSENNKKYFKTNYPQHTAKLQVIHNWYSEFPQRECSINLVKYKSSYDFILLYAGNIGPAQDLELIIKIMNHKLFKRCLLVIVGDGRNKQALQSNNTLKNVLFFDQIPIDEILSLYKQVDVGIISLNTKHKTHNIPGKLLPYIAAGLPIFAAVNPKNDLIDFIKNYNIGTVSDSSNISELSLALNNCLDLIRNDKNIDIRCKKMMNDNFTTKEIAKRIYDIFNM